MFKIVSYSSILIMAALCFPSSASSAEFFAPVRVSINGEERVWPVDSSKLLIAWKDTTVHWAEEGS